MVTHQIPSTLEDALKLLESKEYLIMGGGTDLMVQARSWAMTLPNLKKPLVFINQLKELNFIEESKEYLEIGAATTYDTLLKSPLIPKVLKDTIVEIAAPGIRYLGTIGGNIANASPAADAVCTLIALDALVEIVSVNTTRTEKISDFIIGVKKTTLKPDELIRSIKIPALDHDVAKFYKVGGRKADAISKVSLCGICNIKDNVITKFRVALGAVGPKVVSDIQTDELFVGKTIDEIKITVNDMIKNYEPLISPIDDQRSTKDYRFQVSLNLLKAFIESL